MFQIGKFKRNLAERRRRAEDAASKKDVAIYGQDDGDHEQTGRYLPIRGT